jgi:hypothetical protein
MLRDFHVPLSPETEPLDQARREDHLRWRGETLPRLGGSCSGCARTLVETGLYPGCVVAVVVAHSNRSASLRSWPQERLPSVGRPTKKMARSRLCTSR